MTRLNTTMPNLRVTVNPALEPGWPCLMAWPRGRGSRTVGHSREGSPAALSSTQDAGGQDESVIDERDIDLLLPTARPQP